MPNTDYITPSMAVAKADRVLLIYTGGTIGMGQNSDTGALEPLDFNHLLKCLPEFSMLNLS